MVDHLRIVDRLVSDRMASFRRPSPTHGSLLAGGDSAVLLFFASVLAHELAHSLVARSRGLPVSRISLFIFGGVSDIEREPESAGVDFQMAFVGPLTSLVLGALLLMVAKVIGPSSALVGAVFGYLGITNVLLGAFNLLPGFPLDGGRVLRSILWKLTGSLTRATRIAANAGQVISYLMILTGIWLFFHGDVLDGLWIGFIALFLLLAAQAESTQITLESTTVGITVDQVMSPVPPVAPPEYPIQRAVDEYVLLTGQRVVPVVQGELLAGMVTLRDIRKVPRENWASETLGQIMIPLAKLLAVTPSQPLIDAVNMLEEIQVGQLPVVADGRMVGIIERDTVISWVNLRQDLGRDQGSGSSASASEERKPVASSR